MGKRRLGFVTASMPNTGKSTRSRDHAVFTLMPCFAERLVLPRVGNPPRNEMPTPTAPIADVPFAGPSAGSITASCVRDSIKA